MPGLLMWRFARQHFVQHTALSIKVLPSAVSGTVTLLVAVLVGDMGASLTVTLNAMRLTRLK